MSAQAPVDPTSPLAVAWERYKSTKEYANTLRWATHPEHAEGSLWAAFVQGFGAGAPEAAEPLDLATLVETYVAAVRRNGYIAGIDSVSSWHEEDEADEATPRAALLAAVRRAEALQADMEYAAGECLVPMPVPGSDMSRVLIANRLIRRGRDANAEDAERYRFLRDNPLQLRAIDGSASFRGQWSAAHFDQFTDVAMLQKRMEAMATGPEDTTDAK